MTFGPRQLNDFTMKPGPLTPNEVFDSMADGPVEVGDAEKHAADGQARIESANPAEHQRIAQEWVAREFDRMRASWTAFEMAIVGRMQTYCHTFHDARETKLSFMEVYRLCERRAKARLEIVTDEEGAVRRDLGDGNRKMGFSLGLPMSAINTAVPVVSQYLLDSGSSPNLISAIGDDDENPDKEQVISLLVDDQHTNAGFPNAVAEAARQVCTFQAGVLRQRWVEKIGVEPDAKTGELVERVTHEGMTLEPWPLPWVLVSDLNKQRAEDQSLVIWYSQVLAEKLLEEEMVIDVKGRMYCDPTTGDLIPEQTYVKSGRFFNLEMEKIEQDRTVPTAGNVNKTVHRVLGLIFEGREIDESQRTATPLIGVIEAEGRLHLADLVKSGTINGDVLDILAMFGVNIPGAKQMTRRELGRKLGSIHWNLAITQTGHLIEFRPCPYRPAQNTMHKACYVNGDGFYGQGIVQLGNDVDELIEQHVNANMEIAMHRAEPNHAIDSRPMTNQDGEVISNSEVAKLLRGFSEAVFVNGNVNEAITAIFPEGNPQWIAELETLVNQYQERTFINEAVRGARVQGQTATANRNDLAQGLTRVIERGKQMGRDVVEPIDRRLMQHMTYFLSAPGKFEAYVIRVAGAKGLKAHFMFPSVEGLDKQFKIIHSGDDSMNREVQTAQFGLIRQFYVQAGVMDPEKALIEELQMNDRKNPDRFLMRGAMEKDPRQEIKAFASGRYLAPSQRENPIEHYRTHLAQLAALDPQQLLQLDPMLVQAAAAQGVQVGQVPPGLENWRFDPSIIVPQLVQHMKETESMINNMVAAAQAQAMEQQQVGQSGQKPAQTTQGSLQGGVRNSVAKPPMGGLLNAQVA